MTGFYDRLAPYYHLIYPDWNASIDRQAGALDEMIRRRCPEASTLLDVACGIGTQALGLAALGYDVTASDLSPGAVDRARAEADRRGLRIAFDVADMSRARDHFGSAFDVVISCDNAVAHLLADSDLLSCFRQWHACTRSGGVCLVSARDYSAEPRSGTQLRPYGVRSENGVRYVLWQVWEFEDDRPIYRGDFYFVEDDGAQASVHVMRSTYHAVSLDRLAELLTEAGFADVERIDGRFFQPVLIGSRR